MSFESVNSIGWGFQGVCDFLAHRNNTSIISAKGETTNLTKKQFEDKGVWNQVMLAISILFCTRYISAEKSGKYVIVPRAKWNSWLLQTKPEQSMPFAVPHLKKYVVNDEAKIQKIADTIIYYQKGRANKESIISWLLQEGYRHDEIELAYQGTYRKAASNVVPQPVLEPIKSIKNVQVRNLIN